ncbi:MAG: SAM-dependent chlorinase/fluorinase [Chitinophagales bacterium]
MAIVTLTSDLGVKDHYVAVIKGKLMTGAPGVQVVDISHEVAPFNIQEAAFILRNAYTHFPAGTIHMVSVHAENKSPVKGVIIQYNGHVFVGMDNGLFSLLFDDEPEFIFEIDGSAQVTSTFPAKDILSAVVSALASGQAPATLGTPLGALSSRTYLRPPDNDFLMRANIVYIDRFGNLVTNVSKERFEQKRAGRTFVINYKRTEEIRAISATYNDVSEGERLCLFNASGNLEIAINKGSASQLLGLHIDDIIQIEFQ